MKDRIQRKRAAATAILLGIFCPFGAQGEQKHLMEGEPMTKVEYRLEKLGFASRSVSYYNNFAVLADAPDGRGGFFYISYFRTHGRAEILAYNRQTKERRRYRSQSGGLYGMMLASDGTIYAGGVNSGELYALRPGSNKLDNLGNIGRRFIYDLTEAPDGKIYGGSYNGSRLLQYDPDTGKCKDLGSMSDSRDYLRSLASDADGRIWCSLKHPALLFVYDPATGEKEQVLPPDFQSNSFAGLITARGEYVYVPVDGYGTKASKPTLLVFEAKTKELVHRLELPRNVNYIPGDYTAGLYFRQPKTGRCYYYHPETKRPEKLCDEDLGLSKWVEAGRYVHGLLDQDYYCYDLKEQKFLDRTRLTPTDGPGMYVYCLGAGPDGDIYGGTYINQHLWKVDAAKGEIIDLGIHRRGGGQVDSVTSGGGRLWCGSYIMAHVSCYDPEKPWNPGTGRKNNPRDYGSVGHGQYRTHCILYGPDDKVYLGSYPSFSSGDTSALCVLDPETGKIDAYTDLAPECLAACSKLVFGAGDESFFAFDPAEKETVFSMPVGFTTMAGLPDGRIIGAAGTKVRIVDPEKKNVVAGKDLNVGEIDTLISGRDNNVYGISKGAVFRLNTEDLSVETIHQAGGKFLAEDRFGNLYFARGPELFRLVREAPSQDASGS